MSINGNSQGREISLRSIDLTLPGDMKPGNFASGGARFQRRAEVTPAQRM
jgi:hypothetical protein